MTPGAAALAAGYFAYFAAVGVYQPYWPVRLAALGLPATGIGALLALVNAVRLVAPLGAASLADRAPDRRALIRGLAGLAAVGGVLLALARGTAAMAASLVVYGIAVHGFLPVFDADALDRLGRDRHRYGLLRLWGSVGFVVAAAATGALVARYGSGAIAVALAVALGATALVVQRLPAAPAGARPAPLGVRDFLRALRGPGLARFLAIVFLQQAGFGGYYGFYTLYLDYHGYGAAAAGLYWAAAVLAEIGLFAVGARLVGRFRLEALLRVALAGTVLRWLIVAALPESRPAMLAAQLLHLAGFGLFHLVTVQLAPHFLPAGGAARAQALVASVGWGAGGIAGSLIAGVVWQALGPRAVFLVAAGLALAALALAVRPVQGPDGGADHALRGA